jgi:transcriptional regulator with XRE-family HTH domain
MSAEKLFTKFQVVESLRLQMGMKAQNVFAEELGISPQLLSEVLKGTRSVPVPALDFLGLEDVGKRYRRKAGGSK